MLPPLIVISFLNDQRLGLARLGATRVPDASPRGRLSQAFSGLTTAETLRNLPKTRVKRSGTRTRF
ncbi:hypothetical protein F4054_13360 [Candidatus Poribacteria bacterium]|nr:hypothetical protein [Candidatus Poribacteria bacterium]MYG08858.1 hypothetical protein [Candidatus Poribacteria bacterium]MYK23232.1 hypothetical protein [Candidatus Poribacteria bacterium]